MATAKQATAATARPANPDTSRDGCTARGLGRLWGRVRVAGRMNSSMSRETLSRVAFVSTRGRVCSSVRRVPDEHNRTSPSPPRNSLLAHKAEHWVDVRGRSRGGHSGYCSRRVTGCSDCRSPKTAVLTETASVSGDRSGPVLRLDDEDALRPNGDVVHVRERPSRPTSGRGTPSTQWKGASPAEPPLRARPPRRAPTCRPPASDAQPCPSSGVRNGSSRLSPATRHPRSPTTS